MTPGATLARRIQQPRDVSRRPRRAQDYFSWVEIDENVLFSLGPMPLTVGMIASAMPAAMMAYSIAVAPDWSLMNAESFGSMATYRPPHLKLRLTRARNNSFRTLGF